MQLHLECVCAFDYSIAPHWAAGQCGAVLGLRVKGLVSVTVVEAALYKQRGTA